MNLLPHKDFELIVDRPVMEVCDQLAAEVGPKNFWGVFSKKKELRFDGNVEDDKFTICKNVYTQNILVPVLFGTFEPLKSGTKINVKMKVKPVEASIFLALLAAAIISIIPSTSGLPTETKNNVLLITIAGIFVTYIVFYFQALRSKSAFLNIFRSKGDSRED